MAAVCEAAAGWTDVIWDQVRHLKAVLMRQLHNDLIGGGLALALAQLMLSCWWQLLSAVQGGLRSRLFTTYELPKGTAPFFALQTWLRAQPAARSTAFRTVAAAAQVDAQVEGSVRPRYVTTASLQHKVRFMWRGRVVSVRCEPHASSVGGIASPAAEHCSSANSWFQKFSLATGLAPITQPADGGGGGSSHSMQISIMGWNTDAVLFAMLEEGRRLSESTANRFTQLYVPSSERRGSAGLVGRRPEWVDAGRRPSRSLSSVVLEEGEAERVLADTRSFLASERWYAERGIPYRRGYLLYGEPGSGKTSLITALAGELQLSIYMLRLSGGAMDDDGLLHLLNTVAPRSIVLVEDIDAAFPDGRTGGGAHEGGSGITQQAHPHHQSHGITFSGLLNALDGVSASESRLLFLTTNHLHRLDLALIRPGRVDVRLHFQRASKQQAARLFQCFYRGGDHAIEDSRLAQWGEAFADQVQERKMSMAAIQGFLMLHRDNPQAAVKGYVVSSHPHPPDPSPAFLQLPWAQDAVAGVT